MRLIVAFLVLLSTQLPQAIACVAAPLSPVEEAYRQMEASSGDERVAAANNVMRLLAEGKITDEPVKFSPDVSRDTLNMKVWYWMAEYFYAYQDYVQARKLASQALPIAKGGDYEANCLSLLSLCCYRTSDYENAAHYAKQCYKLDEQTGDPDLMSSSLNTLAGIYIGANRPREAEKYILKGLDMADKADNPARKAVLHGMASEVYHQMVNDREALKHIDVACGIERQLGRLDKLQVRLTQKASVLIGLERYADAEQILSSVIPELSKSPDKTSLGIACNKMGKALLAQGRESEAVAYYRRGATIFSELGDLANEMHSRRGLYESLWHSHPDSAKLELDRFDLLKDSLYSTASAESLARYNAEFGIDELQSENERQRRRTWIAIGVGGVLAIVIACLVWWLMRRLARKKEKHLLSLIEQMKQNGDRQQPEDAPTIQISDEDRNLLERIRDVVLTKMTGGGPTVETIAEEMCLTAGQLNRRVKRLTGVTTQHYALSIRLNAACEMLSGDRQLSVQQVAYMCGFEDATTFTRAFKRLYNLTPTQFRAQATKQPVGE